MLLEVWNAAIGHCITRRKGHGSSVNSVPFSPDGSRLASVSHDRTVNV